MEQWHLQFKNSSLGLIRHTKIRCHQGDQPSKENQTGADPRSCNDSSPERPIESGTANQLKLGKGDRKMIRVPKDTGECVYILCAASQKCSQTFSARNEQAVIARELGNQWKAISEDGKREQYGVYEKDKKLLLQEMRLLIEILHQSRLC